MLVRQEREATPIDNPSVRKLLDPGEHQYLTTPGHCDCGTVLAPRSNRVGLDTEEGLRKETARLARKGWSEAKIARSLDDRIRALQRPGGGREDSLELWSAVIFNLKSELSLPYAGLLVHFYRGYISTEEFKVSRRLVRKDLPLMEALSSIAGDELAIFKLR